ncbi:PIR protein, putative [Plasmodium sp. gorilla clade G1]|nr:PIR protein, putative [Plasmodium sp. gorilla clade G1]
MKLHYTNILLFSLPLNILAHNKNKPYIISHARTTTSRVLSECELYMSNYDNDPDMKSVKENFERQTSQRFKKYEERMHEKRRKCKEQCERDIKQIIVKDKIEKTLAKKVERGCLMCACGLGGGVTPVWVLVSGLWYATWSQYVIQSPIQKGIEAVISQFESMPGINSLPGFNLANIVNQTNYLSCSLLTKDINAVAKPICEVSQNAHLRFCNFTSHNGQSIISQVSNGAESAVAAGKHAASAEATTLAEKTLILTNAITASFVAIVVIVLVMLMIYLILRYLRKKKMNKKQQYTKLLKE